MEINFTKKICVPSESITEDDELVTVEFTASFFSGGIGQFEHFGFKGRDSGPELDEITFDKDKLTQKQIDYIKDLIEDGDLDSDSWDKLNA